MAEPLPSNKQAGPSEDGSSEAHDPTRPTLDEYLDEQEDQSFPASDPHSDWAGPGGQHHPRPG
jgi:hypothetical protein